MHPWEEFRQTYPYGKLQFTTKVGYTGIIRITDLDTLCGYVVLPKDHLFFEKSVYDFDDVSLDVYGGVIFADYLDKDTYAIGFNCANSNDCIPGLRLGLDYLTWRDETFVRDEIEYLAEQLKEKELSND